MTAAAAAGYCHAVHPYFYLQPGTGASAEYPRGFTPDGYELVPPPGILGAVRRNYVARRTSTSADEGVNNTCEDACRELGRGYEPAYSGAPLHQKVDGSAIIVSGLGDMAASAVVDREYSFGGEVVVGIVSRGNNWHTQDVAQADFCCCTVR